MAAGQPSDLFLPERSDDFTHPRMLWLVKLRWVAVLGILVAGLVSLLGFYPGVRWPVLVGTSLAGATYNFLLWRSHKDTGAPTGFRAAMFQASVDILMLTVVLWAAGGLASPFVAYYVFHVALVGILSGTRATLYAAGLSTLGALFLAVTHYVPALELGRWAPVPPWDYVAHITAFTTTAGGVAYLVTHAVRELRVREKALARARDQVALEYQLLSNTLNELEAGLEVVDENGEILWRNKRAEVLGPQSPVGGSWICPGTEHSCEKDVTGVCPVKAALAEGQPGRCRFAAVVDGVERVYEMMTYPLEASDASRVMNLYVDRTEATIDERRLVTTERLVSLGRIAQGVAHELNTPLATIRTLAADMRVALRGLPSGAEETVADLDESAALIQDETRRLGRITQALLAGGDLVRTRIDGTVSVAAVVERARALVFAGVRGGPAIEIDPSVDDLEVTADTDRMVQVLVNLLQNAYDAVRDREGSHVRVRASVADGRVELVVEDDGPGVPAEVEAHLFEPFTTTKPPGQGTGLGLYTTYMLVRAMGGAVSLETRPEGGARATVRLAAATKDGLAPVSRLTQRAS